MLAAAWRWSALGFLASLLQLSCPAGTAGALRIDSVKVDRCGDGLCSGNEDCSSCPRDCLTPAGRPCPRAGAMYSLWHAPATLAMRQLEKQGRPTLTVQQVIDSQASGGPLRLADVLVRPQLAQLAAAFYYHHTPDPNFYCVLTPRVPGTLHAELPGLATADKADALRCPESDAILIQHARQLRAAGIDHIVVDLTNFPRYSAASDTMGLRPLEDLLRVWSGLRAAGEHTPDVAAWQALDTTPLPSDGTDAQALAPLVLDLYNQPYYADLWLRAPQTDQKIFFYPVPKEASPAKSRIQSVAANGGRNDILAQPMWTNQTDQGVWSFMERCRNFPDNGATGSAADCNQAFVVRSPLGSQMAVSPSYQLGYASQAGEAIGHLRGATLRAQFHTALTAAPDWLLLSSWNEHVAQNQKSAAPCMGLENDDTLPGQQNFVDIYGVEFSRDLEPTREEGDGLYRLMASCLRLWRRGATACDDAQELCCQNANFNATWTTYGIGKAAFTFFTDAAAAGSNSQPLYLCPKIAGIALSTSADCSTFAAALATTPASPGSLLGYVSRAGTYECLRQLWTCAAADSLGYTLNRSCPAGSTRQTFLGYVH